MPATHPDLSTAGVLVGDWLEGLTLADAPPPDPDATARALVAVHVTAARAGLLLSDARPNHYVMLADGRIGLLGVSTLPVDRAHLERRLALLPALRDPCPTAFAAAAADLLQDPAAAHAHLRDALGDMVRGPAQLDASALPGVLNAPTPTPSPGDLPLAWSAGRLIAVLAGLNAELDWTALIRPGTARRPSGRSPRA